MAKGSIEGKNARRFAERAKMPHHLILIEKYLLPELKLGKNVRIADFCAGSGNVIPYLQGKVKEIAEIDSSIEMINIMKEGYGSFRDVKIIHSDVSKVPLPDDSYDYVFIKLSVHHIWNIEPVFAEAYRILRENGRLIVIDMVFDGSFAGRISLPFMKLFKSFKNGMHELFCRYRTNEKILQLLREGGFFIVKAHEIKEASRRKHYPDHIYVAEKR